MSKRLVAFFLIPCISLIIGSPSIATTQQTPAFTRLSGLTQFETAKAISEHFKSGKAQNVILSTGNGFADALSAGVLAHQLDAPILLVDALVNDSKDAFDYITQHLDPAGTVHIIGGTGVINKDFETKLNNLGFKNIIRIAGYDAYETSYLVAHSLKDSTVSTMVISSGEQYPDALSISSFAANKGWPILLTAKNALPQIIKDFLLEKKPSKVYITGGTGVISDNVKSEINSILPQTNIERLAGQSRFDTNAIITGTFATKPSSVYLSTGNGFADALAGSVLAAQKGDPVVIIDPSTPTLPESVASYLGKLYSSSDVSPNLITFGGNSVVPEPVIISANELVTGVAKEYSICYVPDITATVTHYQSKPYDFPATVEVKLYNSHTIDLPVKWHNNRLDLSKIGSNVYEGVIDGYSKTIKLTVNVIARTTIYPEYQKILEAIPDIKMHDYRTLIYGESNIFQIEIYTKNNQDFNYLILVNKNNKDDIVAYSALEKTLAILIGSSPDEILYELKKLPFHVPKQMYVNGKSVLIQTGTILDNIWVKTYTF